MLLDARRSTGTDPTASQGAQFIEVSTVLRRHPDPPNGTIVYAINRFQAERGTWYWVVHFKRAGKLHYRRFYEPKHGGTLAARRAAVAWRDERLAEIKAFGILEFCGLKRSNNSSGVPGVHFLAPANQPEGIWQAKLKLSGGKARSKSFSVRLHGHRQAFKLAVAARKQMLAVAQDRPFLHDPLAKRFAARQGTTEAT